MIHDATQYSGTMFLKTELHIRGLKTITTKYKIAQSNTLQI